MKGKMISFLVMTLVVTATALPVIGFAVQDNHGDKYTMSKSSDVNLDVAITTDWVNDYQDHGLRVREFNLDQDVYAYIEVSSDDLYGVDITQVWWYNNGTGLENKWQWTYTVEEHWSSCGTWTWWAIGLDYGKGVGYIEVLINGEHLGQTNWYAIENTKPNKPTITGETNGKTGVEYEYKFTGIDPDGFDVSYFVDWGDGTTTGWSDFVASGTELTLKHSWSEKGDYTIKCKVKDLAENESEWGELIVTMPRNREYYFKFDLLDIILERFPNAFPLLRQLKKL